MTQRKKLIEVALPLEAINKASAREKSIRHGHPSTLHLWWARRPLAAARAVIFTSLVDDPDNPEAPPEFVQACRDLPRDKNAVVNDTPRMRLFDFIELLVQWESTTNEDVIGAARRLIRLSTDNNPPPLLDPFAGGGSIPLEAQRLGLEAHASDLNPVAVMINKAIIEIPPRFANRPPVNPRDRATMVGSGEGWKGAAGLAADVRYYGEWMRDEAFKRIGHLYPRHNGETVIAWLWARTVKCPNPACGCQMPLVRSFELSKKDKRRAWVEPITSQKDKTVTFRVVTGNGNAPPDDDDERRDAPSHGGGGRDAPRRVSTPSPTPDATPSPRDAALPNDDDGRRGAPPNDDDGHRDAPPNDDDGHRDALPDDGGGRGDAPSHGGGGGGRDAPRRVSTPSPTPDATPSPRDAAPPNDDERRDAPLHGGGGRDAPRRVSTAPAPPEGTVNRRGARCVRCGTPVPFDYVREEGKAGRMSAQMMAIVTEGQGGRSYYAPTPEQEAVARVPIPVSAPDTELPEQALGFRVQLYGMTHHRDLFTPRQLVALTTFSDLVAEAREQCYRDAQAALETRAAWQDETPLRDGGAGARAYAEAVSVYLAFSVDRLTDRGCSLATWQNSADKVRGVFSRQAIPMVWDFAEVNSFSQSSGNFYDNIEWVTEVIDAGKTNIFEGTRNITNASQRDAISPIKDTGPAIISTDPPYYDNIGYADLSDFFYVWLRPMLREVYPDLFATVLVPKTAELVATSYRFDGDKEAANCFFENGLRQAFSSMRQIISLDYPLTVYYAFKQTESDESDESDESTATITASSGWETILTGLVLSGFVIDGTWPMRTERSVRSVSLGANALASSIILVCRPRSESAPTITRRQFVDLLRRELPAALKELQSGNIAPVDLAQASIGPGMAIYSRYSKVLEADGSALSVRAALGLINQELDAYLAEQDGDIDAETRFAVAWFEQYGFDEGEFGVADVLARAKGTSVDGIARAGVVKAGRGKVQLLHWRDYDPGAWNPQTDRRLTVWEAAHHLIERLNNGGEQRVGLLLTQLRDDIATEARNLAYRLYNICERKGWSEHARDYNALVVQWAGAQEQAKAAPGRLEQGGLGLVGL